MTIRTWLEENTKHLKNAGVTSARLDALLLLEDALDKSREWILAHDETKIDAPHLLKLNTKITQRTHRIPLAYIRGVQEFYGRTFYVNTDVLIPRPESEAIITQLKVLDERHNFNIIIDIGTGSGCLGVTVGLELPKKHILVTDISPKALVVARKNARAHNVHIRFLHSDLLENLPNMPTTRSYVMLANLPYVPANLITSPEIAKEPSIALFSGVDGLDHYRKFWQQITQLKNRPEAVITESLKEQHAPMEQLAAKAGFKLYSSELLVQSFVKE